MLRGDQVVLCPGGGLTVDAVRFGELARPALTGDVPAHRRRQVHRDTARRLVEVGASPVRIGHHFLAAGAGADAVPHLL